MAASLIGRALGKYQIVDLIGRGGMATVYKAFQEDVERFVAVKVLPPHPGQDSQYIERFRLEARTIARLEHPHILPLYDYGVQDDILYLVTMYVEGGSLNDRLRQGTLPLSTIDRLLTQIASALDYAHRQGVIHRDIKPDNILLDREGYARLADFGIVKLVEQAEGNKLTYTGGLIGTPAYMSPEQGQGGTIDRRSDIYSLAVVVYEMLTGRQPYDAETPMQILYQHISAPVPTLGDLLRPVPEALEGVIQRALAKNPEDRYQTASAFAEAFSSVLRADWAVRQESATTGAATGAEFGLPAKSAAVTPDPRGFAETQALPSTQPPTPPARRWLPIAAVAAALVLVIVLALLTRFGGQSAPTSEAPLPTTAATSAAAAPPTVAPTSPPTSAAAAAVPTFGRVNFTSGAQLGDSVNLTVENVNQPGSGLRYVAWLAHTPSDRLLRLGELPVDALGSGQLAYTSPDGLALPALYNALLITLESSADPDAPSGEVAYSGFVPPEVTAALLDSLIASEDGIPPTGSATPDAHAAHGELPSGSSLLDGALTEAQIARQHAGLAAGATTVGAMQLHAEHTINILRGTADDLDGSGRGENPGRGFGVPIFLNRIGDRLNAAANAPQASRRVQSQVELIRVCINNALNWTEQVIALESEMLAANDLTTVAAQMAQSTDLTAALTDGVDLNQNGQVDPFEGECGLDQIATFGVLVANMDITAGPPPAAE